MKSRNRTPLTILTTIGLSLLLSASAPVASEAATSTISSRYITVSADGIIKVTPDIVVVNATVSVVGTSNSEALSLANASYAAVRQALKSKAIASKDVATQSISVYPEYNYSNNTQTLTGYRASQSLTITVHNTANAGAVVDAIVSAGGNSIQLNSASPEVSNREVGLAAARVAAVKVATLKAKSYAKLLGTRLGKVNYLVENADSYPSPHPIYSATSRDSSIPTQIDLGQQQVTVTITVQWNLL